MVNRSDTAQAGAWIQFGSVFAALALFFGGYAPFYLRRYPVRAAQVAAIYICLLGLFGLYLAPAFLPVRDALRERLQGFKGAVWGIFVFLLPYLIYSAGTGDFRWLAFAKLCALCSVPFALFAAMPVRAPLRLNWQDVGVLLWLALPVLFGKLAGIWNVPVNLDFMARLFIVGVGAWSFLIWRRVEGAGYEFRQVPLKDIVLPFAGFAAIAIPLGFALHFVAWNPHWRGPLALTFDFATIFLFVAVVEELLFRGLLQNLLERTLQSRYVAQAIAAAVFGLTHIRHAPFPNWRYVILASLAGWFYGAAYRSHRSLLASSAMHALVDTIWRTWLTLPKG